jgi:hypothetical protein
MQDAILTTLATVLGIPNSGNNRGQLAVQLRTDVLTDCIHVVRSPSETILSYDSLVIRLGVTGDAEEQSSDEAHMSILPEVVQHQQHGERTVKVGEQGIKEEIGCRLLQSTELLYHGLDDTTEVEDHKDDATHTQHDGQTVDAFLGDTHASLALTGCNLAALRSPLGCEQRRTDEEGDYVAGRDACGSLAHASYYTHSQRGASPTCMFFCRPPENFA